MKTVAAWTTALAMGFAGAALAQQPRQDESIGQTTGRVSDRAEQATSRTVNPPAGDPSFGQRAGRVFDRMEDGIQGVWNRVTGRASAPEVPRSAAEDPTRRMGSGAGSVPPPADPGVDPLRRKRMDEAYRNSQSRER